MSLSFVTVWLGVTVTFDKLHTKNSVHAWRTDQRLLLTRRLSVRRAHPEPSPRVTVQLTECFIIPMYYFARAGKMKIDSSILSPGLFVQVGPAVIKEKSNTWRKMLLKSWLVLTGVRRRPGFNRRQRASVTDEPQAEALLCRSQARIRLYVAPEKMMESHIGLAFGKERRGKRHEAAALVCFRRHLELGG